MIILLLIVIGLVMWSLHLYRSAFNHREFALMLAGTLVAVSAAGIIVVYFLMEGYMGHMTKAVRYQLPLDNEMIESAWSGSAEADIALSKELGFKPYTLDMSPHSPELSGASHP